MAPRKPTTFLTEQGAADTHVFNTYLANFDGVLPAVYEETADFLKQGEPFDLRRLEFQERMSAFIEQLKGNFGFLDQPKDFEPAHRTKAKLFQEIFTPEAFRRNFSRDDINEQGEEHVIEDCIVDPTCITKHMLEVFGLEHLWPRVGIRKHVRLSELAEIIPAIKEFFTDGLEVLTPDCRMLRITKGKNRGKIVITRSNGPNGFKTLVMTEIHRVGRMTEHIEEGYSQKDLKVLRDIKQMIDSVTTTVLKGWDPKKVRDLETSVSSAIEELSPRVKNLHKKVILGRVEQCKTFQDKTGRLNPYSRLALLNSCIRFINTRITDVKDISVWPNSDRDAASSMMKADTAKIEEWFGAVTGKFASRNDIAGVDRPLNPNEIQAALSGIRHHRQALSKLEFQPYMGLAQKALAELDMMETTILDSSDLNTDLPVMQESFAHVYALAKLIEVERRVIELRDKFFGAGVKHHEIAPNAVRSRLSEIMKILSRRPVAPMVHLDTLSPEYSLAIASVREMNELAKDACRAPVIESTTLMQQIDNLLRDFSIGNIIDEVEKAKKA